MALFFDVETKPLPWPQIEKIVDPFDEESVVATLIPKKKPDPFDASSVKVGNLKDEAKIFEKIEAERTKHRETEAEYERLIAEIPTLVATAKEGWKQAHIDEATLDAALSHSLIIVYAETNSDLTQVATLIDDGWQRPEEGDSEEQRMLNGFWRRYRGSLAMQSPMVGVNICDFDVQYLVRRSWLNGIDVPDDVIQSDRFFNPIFIDLRKRWLLGQLPAKVKSSFDRIGKAFGTGGKIHGDGKGFWKLWETDRPRAEQYAIEDVMQPIEWAKRMGIRF